MKNKKLNELINPPQTQPSLEEQQAFIDELVSRSKARQEELKIWMESFKKKHGLSDEIN